MGLTHAPTALTTTVTDANSSVVLVQHVAHARSGCILSTRITAASTEAINGTVSACPGSTV
ncbi:hypothetical protein GCM10009550_71570 [Actinocorallia libanotica]|uniref:Uncharacterized protein n=1 Tax=Actinocorallia libanotica TaxID=46162 RepID=A0ABN1RY18_9ACTN